MGKDGEDGESSDADLTTSPPSANRPGHFEREIRAALRYERGLFVKALLALAVVAVIVTYARCTSPDRFPAVSGPGLNPVITV